MDNRLGFSRSRSILLTMTIPEDHSDLYPIRYVYNYVSEHGGYLQRPTLKLNKHLESKIFLRLGSPVIRERDIKEDERNSVMLFPSASSVYWPTGIQIVGQTRHWKAQLDKTVQGLEDFASDCIAKEIFCKHGKTFAEHARGEMSSFADGWFRFYLYMLPCPDETRAILLAQANFFHNDYMSRMISSPGYVIDPPKSSGQAHIDSTIQQLHEQDRIRGNGGREVIETLKQFFCHKPPPKRFENMDQYLDYRFEDIGIPYIMACIKFSAASDVDLKDPKLKTFIRLAGSHILIVNDLGSWAKEKRAYDSGKAAYLINAVDVMKQLLRLQSDSNSVSMTYAFQLQLECDLDAEIERLMFANTLDSEQWYFIHITLLFLTGTVASTVFMSRYGGEKARIYPSSK
ncbi:hypothetical protein AWENTII_001648 [Aspergillus wentii]